ncbi:hypothetical protein KFK09_019520 [Dendrobium nobile]|uniref:Uncharacterized protein n=1 Tax=Dendrobium nobile TaxID=94219 RepID=A0A8T3AR72_DENNO|nr:hypothetical protein KFK09_019520 [Dendrobium nobile]
MNDELRDFCLQEFANREERRARRLLTRSASETSELLDFDLTRATERGIRARERE